MTVTRDPQRHPGAYAVTAHTAERVTREPPSAPRRFICEYSRGVHQQPYRVLHDALTHAPSGLYRVYIDGREIGAQLSYPSEDDCRRMSIATLAPLRFAADSYLARQRAWRTAKKANP